MFLEEKTRVIGADCDSHDEGLYYEVPVVPEVPEVPKVPAVPTVTISARGEERIHSGHPWIYRADVKHADAGPGDRVIVRSQRGGRPLGSAFYSDKSQIALRMLTRGEAPADDALIRKRVEDAVAFRR